MATVISAISIGLGGPGLLILLGRSLGASTGFRLSLILTSGRQTTEVNPRLGPIALERIWGLAGGQLTGLPRTMHNRLFILIRSAQMAGSELLPVTALLRPLAVPLWSLQAATRAWQSVSADPTLEAALTSPDCDDTALDHCDCLVESIEHV